ncbi:cell division cycle-associated protein 3 [Astyanax mexicanus]|uniref:cell division cycle-associated protein 3 n=1 Tax=Astyanax mexicanus TaxID=7994 RepID=UPI0020CB4CBE|nr:cell division cycle-associated protein 3 [Astyanax mexicanus]
MGSSESKMTVASTPKLEPGKAVHHRRLAELADPRSPSCGISRTPIQVGGAAAAPSVGEVQESVGPVCFDPRSPTPGVARTPLKDSMKVTVSSLARKLSTFFLSDIETADSDSALHPHVSFTKHPSLSTVEQQDELSATEPLLPPQSNHSAPPSSPVACSPSVGYGSFCNSPFVLVGEAQVEVDADEEVTLEEAEEALLLGESPLRRELSLSLLACREGVYSPEFYSSAEERPATPLPPSEEKEHSDHPYALPQVSSEPILPSPEVVQPIEEEKPATEAPAPVSENVPIQAEQPKLADPEPVRTSSKPSSTLNVQRESGILIPRFDPRSPSQAVFKPQWLGVGFGATGVRARGVQSRGKGTSSPLSSRKPPMDENENKVVLGKQKQRGKALLSEGRSPLQILKEANSPRDHQSQMKLKVSTPEKQRFGQMDRRVLALSLNKENH